MPHIGSDCRFCRMRLKPNERVWSGRVAVEMRAPVEYLVGSGSFQLVDHLGQLLDERNLLV